MSDNPVRKYQPLINHSDSAETDLMRLGQQSQFSKRIESFEDIESKTLVVDFYL